MQMGHPSFCKIFEDQSSTHLELPHAFVSRHGKIIPTDPILRCANGEYSWQVKIEKIGGNYSFALGWNNVVKDLDLGATDFLVFRLVDEATFEMDVYSPNCVEKVFPSKSIVIVVDDDDDREDDEEEEEDDDDGDPSFTTVISTTHIHVLRLPRKFVKLAGIDRERTIMLKNSDGNEWKLGLRSDKVSEGRYCLSSGWKNFKRIHDLSEGDECVFKFIKTEDKLCLVTVNGRNRSSSKTLGTMVMKRGRGRPPKHY